MNEASNEFKNEPTNAPAAVDGGKRGSRPKKGRMKYIVGAMLAYGVSVLYGGIPFSSEFVTKLEAGLFFGSIMFIIFGPVHFLLQLFAHWIIAYFWRSPRRREGLVLNLPALIMFLSLLILAAMPPSRASLRAMLKEHFNGRLPESVEVKGYKMWRGLNEGHYEFVFTISTNNFGPWLTNSGFFLDDSYQQTNLNVSNKVWYIDNDSVAAEEGRSNRLHWYQEEARTLGKGATSIDFPCVVYHFQSDKGLTRSDKTVVVGSNGMDVFFYEDFH